MNDVKSHLCLENKVVELRQSITKTHIRNLSGIKEIAIYWISIQGIDQRKDCASGKPQESLQLVERRHSIITAKKNISQEKEHSANEYDLCLRNYSSL